jgi:hypothetical protein
MTKSLRVVSLLCGVAAFLSADTLTLRDGETIQGTFLGGTARQVRMDLNGDIRTYDVAQVESIRFSDPNYQSANQAPRDVPRDVPRDAPRDVARDEPRMRRAPDADSRNYDAPRQTSGALIPTDTQITVRMIDAVDSERARLGETFRASLDEPIVVDGREVIPRGADVLTKLVDDQKSGHIEGRTILTLAIQTITIDGRPVPVTTGDLQTASTGRGKRSAGVIGGGAALGAIIGGIVGGGKGAAIGAGSGAAVGAGSEVLTGGQKVKIPSETRLTFRLQNPVQL